MEKIVVQAELVSAVEEFTSDFKVVGIYFGEGDPERGGQHWNFTRSIGEDEEVCTVKEIQQATVYGGITEFKIDCRGAFCKFDGRASRETGVNELVFQYGLSHQEWNKLCSMAKRVFEGAQYFVISEASDA